MLTMDPGDKIARAYSRIDALKNSLKDCALIKETYVREYHEALQHLADIGFDIKEFMIPQSAVSRIQVGGNYLTREVTYSDERYVEGALFMSKLNAVLTYFQFRRSKEEEKEKPNIGFRGSMKN